MSRKIDVQVEFNRFLQHAPPPGPLNLASILSGVLEKLPRGLSDERKRKILERMLPLLHETSVNLEASGAAAASQELADARTSLMRAFDDAITHENKSQQEAEETIRSLELAYGALLTEVSNATDAAASTLIKTFAPTRLPTAQNAQTLRWLIALYSLALYQARIAGPTFKSLNDSVATGLHERMNEAKAVGESIISEDRMPLTDSGDTSNSTGSVAATVEKNDAPMPDETFADKRGLG
ncbi:hypothetical protein [Stenotrophomonas maltophilia]|uniref:hypothetical protein n=1 Tax=Stenotrophomonas maltophilia TaxID=40324 RepID=UPI0039C2AE24